MSRVLAAVGKRRDGALHQFPGWEHQTRDGVAFRSGQRYYHEGAAMIAGDECAVTRGRPAGHGPHPGLGLQGAYQAVEHLPRASRVERRRTLQRHREEVAQRAGEPLVQHAVGDCRLGGLITAAPDIEELGSGGGAQQRHRTQQHPDYQDSPAPAYQRVGECSHHWKSDLLGWGAVGGPKSPLWGSGRAMLGQAAR